MEQPQDFYYESDWSSPLSTGQILIKTEVNCPSVSMANADWLTYERFVTVGRILGVLLFSTLAGLRLYTAISDPNPPLFFGVNLYYLDAIAWLFFAMLFLKDLVGFTIFERHR